MALSEKAKEARRNYKREWNRANKDKVKASQDRYWERRAAAAAAAADQTPDQGQRRQED
jgi:hypothetical protein